jgi:hypothetical protein
MGSKTTTSSGVFGRALLGALGLLGACGLLGGGLLYAALAVPHKPEAPAAETAKVGPTFAQRAGMAPARTEPARAEIRPAIEPLKTVAPIPAPAVATAPAGVQHAVSERPAVAALEPTENAPAAVPTETGTARTASAERPGKKLLCTTFRTYDPQTQTYRGYDGQIKACRQE